MSYNFTAIEKKWQAYWLKNGSFRALEPGEAGKMPKAYVLGMFPYPSGAGLHVGHVEQQAATDIYCRYLRMKGFNVLHPMGWDAFGLPAEQYAIKQNVQPRITTEQNIDNFRRQIQMLGMSYDWDREIDTTDPMYYRWTQWIFLQLFGSYFHPVEKRARPIEHLINELENGNFVVGPDGSVHVNPTPEGLEAIEGQVGIERKWQELSEGEQREVIDNQRLAYTDEIPVNWCPQLGTVLANEEVIDGKSEVGGFPVVRQPMRQWVLKITDYAERLVSDLDLLDWPESLKEMQRNWIGRSVGAEVDFDIDPAGIPPATDQDEDDEGLSVTVYTTRPDTLYGATYLVLSPEHPMVERITLTANRAAVDAYRKAVAAKSERDRVAETKDKTGVFTGAYAINPVNNEKIPVWIADYVLMGYGTGAIMAVPAHDQRDFDFATKFKLPIRTVVKPADGSHPPAGRAFEGEGIAVNSLSIEGLRTAEAKEKITDGLSAEGVGKRSVKYKLRDWVFSRQRYWGEPFPIILDGEGNPWAVPEGELPVTLPEMADFKPTGTLEPPLSKARDWVNVKLDGKQAARETNTMPQWAGSCWYYLRFIDPLNQNRFVDPVKEKYWMPVDLYVGGAEHAVLHLLYSRFWHKVLFDLGHVSMPEPFRKLVNQGTILGPMQFRIVATLDGKPLSWEKVFENREIVQAEGRFRIGDTEYELKYIDETEVEKKESWFVLRSDNAIRVDAQSYKMSKSRGNVVNPDEIVRDYGADTFRLYEMYMGPLEQQKPWNTRDIVGMSRFLAAVYRNLIGDDESAGKGKISPVGNAKNVRSQQIDPNPLISADISVSSFDPGILAIRNDVERQMHRTIKKVGEDIEALRFNTAIAELIKLSNAMNSIEVFPHGIPSELAETFTLMLAPFAPHLAEEIWSRLGHDKSLARHPWPKYDEAKLVESKIELPIQINGKLRGTIWVSADAEEKLILADAKDLAGVKTWLEGKTLVKQIYVPKKLVSFVVK
jgi:leucyl-tRNA synthetase